MRAQQAEIEFVSALALDDAVFRLRGLRSEETLPSFERIDMGTYKFRIRKMRRDRYGRHFSFVEANLYLRNVSEHETVINGRMAFSGRVFLYVLLFAIALIAGLFLRNIPLGITAILVGSVYGALVLWDRQSLIRLLRRTLVAKRIENLTNV